MTGPVPPEGEAPGASGTPADHVPRHSVPRPPRLPTSRVALRVTLLVGIAAALLLTGTVVLVGPPVADIARDQSVRVATPAHAGGLQRGSDREVLAELHSIDGGYDTNVEAYYADGKKPVIVWGGTTTLVLLDQQLDGFFTGVEKDGADVTARTRIRPGAVGGRMECARMTSQPEGVNGLCVWVNHGALLAFLSPDRAAPRTMAAQVAKMLPDMVSRG